MAFWLAATIGVSHNSSQTETGLACARAKSKEFIKKRFSKLIYLNQKHLNVVLNDLR